MSATLRLMLVVLLSLFGQASVQADDYDETIAVFKAAGDSADFFKTAYGYALFPTIGKGGRRMLGRGGRERQQDVHGDRDPPGSACRRADERVGEDDKEANDDREDPEAFGERRAQDELQPHLAGRVRITADGGVCHPGQDADPDAGADDAEGRQARSDQIHMNPSSLASIERRGV